MNKNYGVLFFWVFYSTPLLGQSFTETFNYTTGDSLRNNGWTSYRTAEGSARLTITNAPLIFPGYPLSGIGKSVQWLGNGGDLLAKTVGSFSSQSIYVSFLMEVATPGRGYFISLGPTNMVDNERGRIWIDTTGNAAGNFQLAITKSGNSLSSTKAIAPKNQPIAVVMKYRMSSGMTDDEVSLYVFTTSFQSYEPESPSIPVYKDSGADRNPLTKVGLRMYNSFKDFKISGLMVRNSWPTVFTHTESIPQTSNFHLLGNYPNPFNPETQIKFLVPHPGQVQLSIFNILGQNIYNQSNTAPNAGINQLTVDLSGSPSGVYFYHLVFANQKLSDKITLSK